MVSLKTINTQKDGENTMGNVKELHSCGRRKYWSEMDNQESIQELMQELIRTQFELKRLSDYVSKLIEHDHYNGMIVSVVKNPNQESFGGFNFRVYEVK